MAGKTLYLIDGHAQIYRAYYAPFAPLTSPRGIPTRAVHVFTQMVLNLLRDRRPDFLAVTLDVGDETVFRVDLDPTYKGNRDPPPEDLPPQIDRIVDILAAMRIPILRLERFEADDIMATLCHRFAGPEMDVYLVSRDKDLDQLLGDHVRLYDPARDREVDAVALVQEKGYGPALAVEAQMLIGDSTDNIVGVPGIGPKKAADLLARYGSVAALIEHADELTPKMRENVLAFRNRMDVVRQLVTLRRDVPIDFDLRTAAVGGFQPEAAASLLEELGLRRLLERVGSTPQPAAAVPAPAMEDSPPDAARGPGKRRAGAARPGAGAGHASLFDSAAAPAARATGPAVELDRTDTPAPAGELLPLPARTAAGEYRLVDTPEALSDLAARLAAAGSFAFDTETTALVPAAADIVGLSFAWEAGHACYVPVRGVGRTVAEGDVRRILGPLFADPAVRKCGQNLKYDLGVLMAAGIDVAGVDFDSMIASFVLDSTRRSHGIDALSLDLFGHRKIATTELIGKGRNQVSFDQLPTDRVCEYACEDADFAWRLRGELDRRLTDPELRSLFHDLEMPLVEVLAAMEHAGVAIDTDLLGRISGQMADRLGDLERRIHRAAGRPFNVNSTQQLGEVLFDQRGLRVVKRTRTGRSTDAEVLEQLAAETDDPIPRLLLEYRELAKLKGTYVDALPEMVCPRTGRIHPSYHQTGAVTGRLSCSDPNLQNIPIRSDVGAQIRRAFVPGRPGHVLVKADYSQIELRVLAHFCRDEALAAAFREDRDIHAFVAAQLAGVPLDQVTDRQRAQAKTVNFGIIYGQSAFGLSRQTGMSLGDARAFIERYFSRYPKIRAFLDQCVAHARRHGYVKTLLGRRRAVPDIDSRNPSARNAAERLAVNTVVQGTAADMIKRAMINLHRRIQRERRPSRMLIQVHDELVFEVPAADAVGESAMIAEEMTGAIRLDVPVKVDVSSGPNWLDVG
jgi:DNA polymerase-1